MGDAIGTALGPFYHAPEVQAVILRATNTLAGGEQGYAGIEEAAQDVLNVMYTAMLFGAFRDYEAPSFTMSDYTLSRADA